ncbi:hypothetical protein SOCEGT47_048070 [Sorangium cellulosum]|uniref:Cytochrome c domain-containing protein n=1 Tax=Sorangium cellulosum TaxID=56 RepID=A0A4P2Q4H7_SORCE|nr:hypothetical protein [Sorangium cellulosum]AUX24270.1 hypothetical protein SOCEGT47_048070 [Sorangium cellulosum]
MRINDLAGLSTASFGKGSQRTFGLLSCVTPLLLGACIVSANPDAEDTAGAGGSVAGAGGAPSGASGGDAPTSTTTSSWTGTGGVGGGDPSTSTATTGSSSTGAAGGGAGGSSGTGSTHPKDHCVDGFDPHPSDATMKDGPAEYIKNGQIDLTVQPEVIAWMEENEWQAAHFEWHSIRRCGPGGLGGSRVDICNSAVPVPPDQECKTTGDGYQFLAMHRHMIQSLKQLWPKHSEQFEGFEKFPTTAEELPEQWRADFRPWSATTLANAKIADEIDKPENLSRFPDEGALGMWIQCFAGVAIPGSSERASGLHGDLHFKWVRPNNTDHGVGNQFTNIDNYMFWKLHGWIDKVWEKYRVAKGLSPDDPKLKDDIAAQCYEMDAIARVINPSLEPNPGTSTPTTESGVFHTAVRPIFESAVHKCSGCHAAPSTGPHAGLSLGGDISSADIVAGLVNKPSKGGGQFRLVVPGNPDQSWLYLKVSGMAASAGCRPSATASCMTGVMPQAADGKPSLTSAELATLRQWIQDGAPAPTQ